jgi:hypothetical protein
VHFADCDLPKVVLFEDEQLSLAGESYDIDIRISRIFVHVHHACSIHIFMYEVSRVKNKSTCSLFKSLFGS